MLLWSANTEKVPGAYSWRRIRVWGPGLGLCHLSKMRRPSKTPENYQFPPRPRFGSMGFQVCGSGFGDSGILNLSLRAGVGRDIKVPRRRGGPSRHFRHRAHGRGLPAMLWRDAPKPTSEYDPLSTHSMGSALHDSW